MFLIQKKKILFLFKNYLCPFSEVYVWDGSMTGSEQNKGVQKLQGHKVWLLLPRIFTVEGHFLHVNVLKEIFFITMIK